jgi:O-antigen ligase
MVELFPGFFFSKLAIRGVPLIYFKGDLALTFTAVSALLLFFNVRGAHRIWAWPVATVELVYVIGGANRASMVAALVALAWIALSRARRFVWVQVACLGAAVLLISGLALLTENTWAQRKLDAVMERAASIADLSGRGTYVTEESGMKGDNNRFRTVWWRTVIEETAAENPVFGLGFGHDLARNFLLEYNPDLADEFTARSPHSIVVSAIGRMGIVGLLLLLAIVTVIFVRSWRVFRDPDADWSTLGIWASVWVIFVSACFGVVLEGPMGAVVFWSLLGIAASAPPTKSAADTAAEERIDLEIEKRQPAPMLR